MVGISDNKKCIKKKADSGMNVAVLSPLVLEAFRVMLMVQNLPANAGASEDAGSTPGSGRSVYSLEMRKCQRMGI